VRFDVMVVGSVTRDRVRVGRETGVDLVGGTAYYTALALRALGAVVAVVTKTAPADRHALTEELRAAGVHVFWRPSAQTSHFEGSFSGAEGKERLLTLRAAADPFRPEDLPEADARVLHLGSLTHDDTPLPVVVAARRRAELLCIDGQGLVRRRIGDRIRHARVRAEPRLALVDVLKVDAREAVLLGGRRLPRQALRSLAAQGPSEVLLTRGGRGSLVLRDGVVHDIPAFRPQRPVDPTGCGDTYMAGYIYQRLQAGASARSCGVLGATLASMALSRHGAVAALSADEREEIRARLEETAR
jgi:sugar/nucleoside kinase (ribokinase family)